MSDVQNITVSANQWTELVARVAALEAQQGATAGLISSLREDFRRLEGRIYALVAAGTATGSAAAAVATHFIG